MLLEPGLIIEQYHLLHVFQIDVVRAELSCGRQREASSQQRRSILKVCSDQKQLTRRTPQEYIQNLCKDVIARNVTSGNVNLVTHVM